MRGAWRSLVALLAAALSLHGGPAAASGLVAPSDNTHVFEGDVAVGLAAAPAGLGVGGDLSVAGASVDARGATLSASGAVQVGTVELGESLAAQFVELPSTLLLEHPAASAGEYRECGAALSGALSYHPQAKVPLVCDGAFWRVLATGAVAPALSADYGMVSSLPGRNCWDIKRNRAAGGGTLQDGPYWVRLADSGNITQVWCDMQSDPQQRAWTLVLKSTVPDGAALLVNDAGAQTPSALANATSPSSGKFADADIQGLKSAHDARSVFRASTETGSASVFFPGTCVYTHARAAWNALTPATQQACSQVSATAVVLDGSSGALSSNYTQCEDWPSGGPAGLNAWMGCGPTATAADATNVVITHRTVGLTNAAIADNPTFGPLGSTTAVANNHLLVWVL